MRACPRFFILHAVTLSNYFVGTYYKQVHICYCICWPQSCLQVHLSRLWVIWKLQIPASPSWFKENYTSPATVETVSVSNLPFEVWHQGKLKPLQILLPQLSLHCQFCFLHLYTFPTGGKLPGFCSSAEVSGWCKRLWGSGWSRGPHDWDHREGRFGCTHV